MGGVNQNRGFRDLSKPTEQGYKMNILVVDDDPSIGILLADALKVEGYQTMICTHPQDALAVSEQKSFELALIDINLPDMSGLEVASKIKHHNPLLDVVFITGYGTFDNAVQAIKIGAYDYLKKPFSINDLNLCLKRFQERRTLKEKVKRAEQRYFHLVQNLPLLVYAICSDFNLAFVNQACFSMLGYTQDEAMNIPNWFLELIHPEDRELVTKQFDSAFRSDRSPFSIECRLIHKKGHSIHVIIKSIPHHDYETDPEVKPLEGIIMDITDRVFLEKALVQKEKLKTLGAISAEVAHEIRNPLVSIGGFARRLLKKSPDLRELEIILCESKRLEKILDRIRNYLKPVKLCAQECSVNRIINECVDLLSPEIEEKGIQCRLNLDSELPVAYADPDILTQVFINLIRNAGAAVVQGEILDIKTYESDQTLHIDFRNPFHGKKVKDPETIFLPLDEGGQSIGLPLCYRLIKNMGGILSLSQERENTVFTISLPKTTGTNSWEEPSFESCDTFNNLIKTPIPTSLQAPPELSVSKEEGFGESEKRRYPRTDVRWPSTIRTSDRTLQGEIRNISMDGAFICCQNPPEPGETFCMLTKSPKGRRLMAINKVAWLGSDVPAGDTMSQGMGARFITISNESRRFLDEVVALY